MLTNTFAHAHGIGYRTEAHLWAQGILTWEDYLAQGAPLGLTRVQRDSLDEVVRKGNEALGRGDASYFAKTLHPSDAWRAYPDFAHTAVCLDIETTGMGANDEVTVIGLYDGERVQSFVQGQNLEEFPAAIRRYGMIISFFGRSFDVPTLQRVFPQIDFDRLLHVDLCFTLRRLGLRGGLKSIERQLGIQRSAETDGMDGFDAVRLWHAYRAGNPEALDLLLRYNAEDIVNLRPLMHYAYESLRAKTFVW